MTKSAPAVSGTVPSRRPSSPTRGGRAPSHEATRSVATALLLGVAALQVDDSPEEWENLTTTLTRAGSLQRIRGHR